MLYVLIHQAKAVLLIQRYQFLIGRAHKKTALISPHMMYAVFIH